MAQRPRLLRFLHLERRRKDVAPGSLTPAQEHRFGSLDTSRAEPIAADAGPHAEQLRNRVDTSLVLDEPRSRPFLRCALCGADSGAHATHCIRCAADLSTAEQQAFNERFFEELEAAREVERKHLAELAGQRELDAEQAARDRREGYEEMAREVREETLSRLGEHHPYGPRQAPLATALTALGVVTLTLAGRSHSRLVFLGFALLTAALVTWLVRWVRK